MPVLFFISYNFSQIHGVILLSAPQAAKVENLRVKYHFWTKSSFCHNLFLAHLREKSVRELKDWLGLKTALKQYFQGQTVDFTKWPLDLENYSLFAKKVLQAVAQIKLGQVKTYRQIAEQVGSSQAARAVGRVLSQNKLPLFVPCHRVVGTKNSGGWSGPFGLKQQLLKLENTTSSCTL